MEKHIKYLSFNTGFKYMLGLLLAILFIGCDEEHPGPIGSDGNAPGQISDIKVIPTPGGADLVYKLPDNDNLSYVEAVVNTPEGKVYKFNASSHRDTISVIGLATTDPQEVLLYSVNRSDVRSEPVSVTIDPLLPPYMAVFKTLAMGKGLGGVDITYLNDTRADLAFFIGRMIDGEFVEEDSYYSDKEDGRYLFWGYKPEKQKFGVFIRDRWDHYSDTLYAEITPLLEVLLEKNKFKAVKLLNDSEYFTTWNQKPENLWDGKWSQDYSNPYDGGGTGWMHGEIKGNKTTRTPGAITIDMGQFANVSRVIVNHYWQYSGAAPRKYEIYGLVDYSQETIPTNLGAWHNWTLLAEAEQARPSATGGSEQDDATYWETGDITMITPPSDGIRYIRIKAVESWDGGQDWDVAEITIYGAPID